MKMSILAMGGRDISEMKMQTGTWRKMSASISRKQELSTISPMTVLILGFRSGRLRADRWRRSGMLPVENIMLVSDVGLRGKERYTLLPMGLNSMGVRTVPL